MGESQVNEPDTRYVVRWPPPREQRQPVKTDTDVLRSLGRIETPSEDGRPADPSGVPAPDQLGFVTGLRLVCLMAGLMVAQFLVSIDRTIISTVS